MDAIKSKERVKQHGEVFTPDSIVNDMLDLVEDSLNKDSLWKYIDSTYLEPACGNGNFLVRILDRKLNAVQKLPKEQWELGLIRALSSIYAIDIQYDNVEETKERLLELIKDGNTDILELENKEKRGFNFIKYDLSSEIESIVKYILNNNIKVGNALNGMQYDRAGKETTTPLVFSEYIWNNNMVVINLYYFNDLDTKIEENSPLHYKSMTSVNTEYNDEASFDDI